MDRYSEDDLFKVIPWRYHIVYSQRLNLQHMSLEGFFTDTLTTDRTPQTSTLYNLYVVMLSMLYKPRLVHPLKLKSFIIVFIWAGGEFHKFGPFTEKKNVWAKDVLQNLT